MQPIIFYSRFGRVLTFIVAGLGVSAGAVIIASGGFWAALTAVPALLAVLIATWVLFYNPRVVITDSGVELTNVFTEVAVPWGEIVRIDTKYALTLITRQRSYSAWGAPAPGRHSVFRANREEGSYLPESTYLAGTVRPGDLTTSDSGAAAAIVRREWERRREAGLLIEGQSAKRRVSWQRALAVALSIGLAAVLSF